MTTYINDRNNIIRTGSNQGMNNYRLTKKKFSRDYISKDYSLHFVKKVGKPNYFILPVSVGK